MNTFEYGIKCHADDEKKLIKRVNAFLVSNGYRKMYKRVPSGSRSRDAACEFRYSHYYCQFLKQQPRWYFDLYPNVDLDGRARFPERRDCGWTFFINKVHPEMNTELDHQVLDKFFAAMVSALGFSVDMLHVYKPGEDRL